MNDSKTAAKLRAQLKRFLGELLPHFSKPRTAFLGDMFYGLMAGGDVKLSEICRAYRPTITMKEAGDRLCMHLGDERIEKQGNQNGNLAMPILTNPIQSSPVTNCNADAPKRLGNFTKRSR